MFVRSFLVVCFVILSVGCQNAYKKIHPVLLVPPPQYTERIIPLSPLARIYLAGNLNVNLHTGDSHPRVIVHGAEQDLKHLKINVKKGILYITLSKSYPHFLNVDMEIDSLNLNSFEYHGTGTIIGNQLRTRMLDLYVDNNGKTILKGQLGLHKLELSGNGYTEISGMNGPSVDIKMSGKQRFKTSGNFHISSLEMDNDSAISLYWIQSKVLTIRAKGNAFIQLAGTAEHLDVEMWGASYFQGRYLRAERAFVKTHNKSVAEISAVARQHALAKDNSDIQFFNIPVMKSDFMANNGAVLDMRDLRFPFVQEYDQYNK